MPYTTLTTHWKWATRGRDLGLWWCSRRSETVNPENPVNPEDPKNQLGPRVGNR